ncbi:uncharacterized protein LOC142230238 [Haematobia irritans]|uniref:uncharacterized protein LOC142230238 n=1 Tax=Haematobia irritans TaxID=7368 RepID=UPI003F4F48DC
MSQICHNLDHLASIGKWDEVFNCLNIEANSMVQLSKLKKPPQIDNQWSTNPRLRLMILKILLAAFGALKFILIGVLLFYTILIIYKFSYYNYEIFATSKDRIKSRVSIDWLIPNRWKKSIEIFKQK